jgi:SAM-dependent methyltransferase
MTTTDSFKTWEEAVKWLRGQPDRQDLVLAAYYDDPLLNAAERYWQSEEWKEIQSFFPSAMSRALDVGAGRGIASFALARDGFSKVVALEPDASNVVGAGAIRLLAQQTGLPICVTEEFSERLPFDDASFDLVFARAVLHHTHDLDVACSEFHRVLRPGGKLIAVREHVLSCTEDLPRFLEIHPLHKLYGGENAFILNKYESAIKSAGFESLITLAPLNSVINFAPFSLNDLQEKIAQELAKNVPWPTSFSRKIIRIFWPVLRPILNAMDRRPGRLYSFVAVKG